MRAREEIGEHVSDSRNVNCRDGEIEFGGDGVEFTEEREEKATAGRLPVDDGHIGCVVNAKESCAVPENGSEHFGGGQDSEELAPADAAM